MKILMHLVSPLQKLVT